MRFEWTDGRSENLRQSSGQALREVSVFEICISLTRSRMRVDLSLGFVWVFCVWVGGFS